MEVSFNNVYKLAIVHGVRKKAKSQTNLNTLVIILEIVGYTVCPQRVVHWELSNYSILLLKRYRCTIKLNCN